MKVSSYLQYFDGVELAVRRQPGALAPRKSVFIDARPGCPVRLERPRIAFWITFPLTLAKMQGGACP